RQRLDRAAVVQLPESERRLFTNVSGLIVERLHERFVDRGVAQLHEGVHRGLADLAVGVLERRGQGRNGPRICIRPLPALRVHVLLVIHVDLDVGLVEAEAARDPLDRSLNGALGDALSHALRGTLRDALSNSLSYSLRDALNDTLRARRRLIGRWIRPGL